MDREEQQALLAGAAIAAVIAVPCAYGAKAHARWVSQQSIPTLAAVSFASSVLGLAAAYLDTKRRLG